VKGFKEIEGKKEKCVKDFKEERERDRGRKIERES